MQGSLGQTKNNRCNSVNVDSSILHEPDARLRLKSIYMFRVKPAAAAIRKYPIRLTRGRLSAGMKPDRAGVRIL